MTQKYNLSNHGKKVSDSTKEVAVVTATSLNLVAGTVLNTASSENHEVRYLVGDDSLGIVKVRETASDNDFENGLYEPIFREQQERLQPQQQQYLFAPRTE
ncbi:MAG TPA: hypothetical protein VGE97_00410 [Nitrososphaera sp.]